MKPLNILFINCDWRNIFENDFDEVYKKLERDRLNPDINNFLFLSWANENYYKIRDERFSAIHIKTRWKFFRPFFDFLSIFIFPYKVSKIKFKPDIILVYDFGLLPSAKILKYFFGGTIIFSLTNMPRVYSRARSFGKLKTIYSSVIEVLYKNFMDKALTINETMKKYMLELGIKNDKIIVFGSDTINRDIVSIKNSTSGVIRKKHKIPDDNKIILSIGRLETEKDFPRLLNIFSKLGDKYFLIILGQGSQENYLKEIIRSLGIENKVIFPGFINRDEIWSYFKDANLFMLLSKAEALGLVFWEAMYMKVPVIGSEASGIVETIGENDERGLILRDNNLDVIKKKIEFCVGDSEEKIEMLERAKSYVESKINNTIDINKLML